MDSVEVVLAMVLAVVASGYLVRVLPFSLPLPFAQIALGALIAKVFRHRVALRRSFIMHRHAVAADLASSARQVESPLTSARNDP